MPRTILDEDHGYFNESAIGFKRWVDLHGVGNNSISKAYNNEEQRREFEKVMTGNASPCQHWKPMNKDGLPANLLTWPRK